MTAEAVGERRRREFRNRRETKFNTNNTTKGAVVK